MSLDKYYKQYTTVNEWKILLASSLVIGVVGVLAWVGDGEK